MWVEALSNIAYRSEGSTRGDSELCKQHSLMFLPASAGMSRKPDRISAPHISHLHTVILISCSACSQTWNVLLLKLISYAQNCHSEAAFSWQRSFAIISVISQCCNSFKWNHQIPGRMWIFTTFTHRNRNLDLHNIIFVLQLSPCFHYYLPGATICAAELQRGKLIFI